MRFEIGQQVWRAAFEGTERFIECTDCGGTGRLRVLFHDDSMVSIECASCAPGFNPPTGRIRVYERHSIAHPDTVKGIEIDGGKTTWRTALAYSVDDENLFATKEEAEARGAVLAAEYDAEELRRIAQKEKPTRTWAWNASYHRKEIKRCESSIKHHTAKLNAANLKARQEKADAAVVPVMGGVS